MVDIPPERVAASLHVEVTDLPTGYDEDITRAEHVVEQFVEPHADPEDTDAVESTAVCVAAAFIAGEEGDAPVSSVQSDTRSYSIDVGNMSDESRDKWAQATMIDPTGRLSSAATGGAGFEFSSF